MSLVVKVLVKQVLCLAVACILTSAYAQQKKVLNDSDNLSYRIIAAENTGWGYDIFQNNRLLIHQPSRPALPGNTGFSTKKQAEVVAKIVKSKKARCHQL